MKIQIKEKYYKGKPVIAINFTDYTKRMNAKVNKMQTREEQKKMELAIYQTSIVGHELRTPLLSSKLLLQSIIDAITNFLIKYNK